MFMVYWSETGEDGGTHARSEHFGGTQMCLALARMEALRAARRAGATIAHITMSSENPDCVSLPGVDVVSPGYNWTKRRTKLRRFG